MGQWQIRGADRSSGRDVGQIYDADTRDQAADLAVKDGMLVETIELLADDNTLPMEPLEPMDALEVALRREAREQGGNTSLEYGTAAHERARRGGPPPRYSALLFAGRTIRIVGMIYIAVAGFMVARFFFPLFVNGALGTTSLDLYAWLEPLGYLALGVVLWAVAELCVALRDIARNSWR